MKSRAVLSASLIIASLTCDSFAQPLEVLWERRYWEDAANSWCRSIEETDDGGFVFSGGVSTDGTFLDRGWVYRVDMNGDSVWGFTYPVDGAWSFSKLIATQDGGFAIAGYEMLEGQEENGRILKISSDGELMWDRSYGGLNRDYFYSVTENSDGSFVLCGSANNESTITGDFWVMKVDENGDSLWSHTFQREGHEVCKGLLSNSVGYILGGNWSFNIDTEMLIMQINGNGDSVWTKSYNSGDFDSFSGILDDHSGGYVIGCQLTALAYDFLMMKINAFGDSLWTRSYHGPIYQDWCNDISNLNGGGYLLGGTSVTAHGFDYWIVATDENGDSLWSQAFGDERRDICYGVKQTSDGGFVLIGTSTYTSWNSGPIWLIRTGQAANAGEQPVPTEFALNQNFPNPFNPSTEIKYQIASPSLVTLNVYDVLGRNVVTLVNETKSAGDYSATFDGAGLPSGVYIYRLQAGEFTQAKKMVLMK